MAQVLNHHHPLSNEQRLNAQYIGRGSIYGNPYTHLLLPPGGNVVKVSSREEAIAGFRAYFQERMATDPDFKHAVELLRGRDLICFCKPLPCHGDVILEYLEAT